MSEVKTVLIVGPNLAFGGVTRYLKDFVSRVETCKVKVFNSARPGKKKIRAGTGYKEAFNAGMIRASVGLLVTLWNLMRFPWVLVFGGIDVVHICGVSYFPFWENALYIFVSRAFRRPVTLHYLGAFDQYYLEVSDKQKKLIEMVLKKLNHLFLLSTRVLEIVENFLPSGKLSVVPSSVDTDLFQTRERIFRDSDQGVRILFVGGLDPFRKGVFDLIQSFAELLKVHPESTLVLTGGESFKEVKPEWEKLGIESNIDFQGWISKERLIELYSSCDFLALPSYNEGLPYVIIEALSSGLPIIASNVGGISEVLNNGENGFVINPGDIRELTDCMIRLTGDIELRRRMSIANREKAIKNYSLAKAIASIEKIFDSLEIGS